MTYENIEVHADGAIGEIVLNRPDRRNAMSPEMGDEIVAAVASLNDARAVRAVLVRGAGKSFSAGGDLSMLKARTEIDGEQNRRGMRAFYDRFLAVRRLRVPTIAALHGHVIGAGLCFALACDLRYAATGTKLGATFVRVGLHPGMGATHLLPRVVGHAHAAELLLTGRVIAAEEAVRIGLVGAVVAPDQLVERARAVALEIAAAAPGAVAQLTATLRDGGRRTLEQALDHEAACQAIDYQSGEVAEACAAFAAKRTPQF